MRTSIGIIVLFVLAAGCSARMTVQVRVASAEEVRATALREKEGVECFALIAASNRAIETQLRQHLKGLDEAFHKYREIIDRTAERLDGEAKKTMQRVAKELPLDSDSLDAFIGFKARLDESLHVRERLRAVPAAASCVRDEPVVAESLIAYRAIVTKLDTDIRNATAPLARQIAERNRELIDDHKISQQTADAAAKEVANIEARKNAVLDAACRTLICDGSLASSDFAYAVASLPDEKWQNLFNEAVAQGRNGNVDIVVKMTERADFTVKGMRFDVSKIPAMVRKGATQGLLLAAQIAGVPIAAAPSTENNVGLAPSSITLAGVIDTQVKREELLAQRRAAIISLGILVASGEKELDSAAGLAQIKASLDAQLPTLSDLLKLTNYP